LVNDNITWDISADYSEDSGLNILNYGLGGSPITGTGDRDNRVANTGLSTQSGEGSLLDQVLAGQGLGVENETWNITSNLEFDIGTGVVNLIAGHRRLSQEFIIDFFDGGLGGEQNSTGGFVIANDGQHNQTSLEAKYTNSFFDDRLDIVAGLFYFTEDNETDFADVFTINPAPGVSVPLVLANRLLENELETFAVYAQGDYSLTEQLTLRAQFKITIE